MTLVLPHGEAAMAVALLWLLMENASMRADSGSQHETNMARLDQHIIAAVLLTLRLGDPALSDEQQDRIDAARTVHEDQLRAFGESL